MSLALDWKGFSFTMIWL